jgi:hypothetical protein
MYLITPIIAGEVDLPLLKSPAARGPVGLDVQSFVRVCEDSHLVFRQWPEIVSSMIQLRTPSRVLVPLGLSVCLSLFGDLTLYAVLATQPDVVGLSLGTVGVILGVNRLIRIPGNPLAGVLLDLKN